MTELDNKLGYEEKSKEYRTFWEKFIQPLRQIAENGKEKNKIAKEFNEILKLVLSELKKKS